MEKLINAPGVRLDIYSLGDFLSGDAWQHPDWQRY